MATELSTPIDTILELTVKIGIRNALERCGISPSVFYAYLDQSPDSQDRYARALKARTELFVDEIIDISDNDSDPHRARNRIQARQWYASKMNAKTYGDKLDLNVNQTVDIGGALKEAQRRSSRVIKDLPKQALPSTSRDIEDLL